jgi:plastocyanin
MSKIGSTIIKLRLMGALGALLLTASGLRAGDIVGTLAVPKPDHAVVYVEKVPGTFRGEHTRMDQQSKIFSPYVLPVVQGSTVEFRNSDSLQHNVFAVGVDEFNLGTWTKGAAREYTFSKLGEVAILCNVHPEMEAYVLVLQNPYFARLDSTGNFRIANVPSGDYVIKAWYRGKTKKQSVKVPATGGITISF